MKTWRPAARAGRRLVRGARHRRRAAAFAGAPSRRRAAGDPQPDPPPRTRGAARAGGDRNAGVPDRAQPLPQPRPARIRRGVPRRHHRRVAGRGAARGAQVRARGRRPEPCCATRCPSNLSLLVPPATRAGELWLSFDSPGRPRLDGRRRVLQHRAHAAHVRSASCSGCSASAPGLRVGASYRWLVRDRAAYRTLAPRRHRRAASDDADPMPRRHPHRPAAPRSPAAPGRAPLLITPRRAASTARRAASVS